MELKNVFSLISVNMDKECFITYCLSDIKVQNIYEITTSFND